MSDTTQEILVFSSIIALVVIYFTFKGIFKTKILNRDPVQIELAYLILEYANSNMDESAATLFAVSSQRVLLTNFITEERDQRTRFAHALSLARPNLTPMQFNSIRLILR